ncbi:BspA family leucine-rich repeat surface protein [Enterococcus ratti]|nr:BspA family leucine-rich repeat surface protein [Enterococcus ratti]
MNKRKLLCVFLVGMLLVATVCSSSSFVLADEDPRLTQEEIQKSKEMIESMNPLNQLTQSSFSGISNVEEQTSETNSVNPIPSNSTTSSTDISKIEKMPTSDTKEPPYLLPQESDFQGDDSDTTRASNNVLIEGSWLTPQQGNIWLSQWEYYTRTYNGYSSVLLRRYKGSSSTVVIPGIIPTNNGTKRVVINSLTDTSNDYLFADTKSLIRNVRIVPGVWNDKTFKVGCLSTQGCALAFRNATNLETVSLTGLDFFNNTPSGGSSLHKITDTSYMFQGCRNLTRVEFPAIGANITNASYMFQSCTSLNNSGLINMDKFFMDDLSVEASQNALNRTPGMFYGCSSLTSVPSLPTKWVIDMEDMFSDCTSLTNFDTTQIRFLTTCAVNLRHMFANCPNLQIVDVSDVVTDPKADTTGMFACPTKTPLLLVAQNWTSASGTSGEAFYNYNNQAANDNRVPYPYPMLDANGGIFANKSSQLSYFNRCTYYTDSLSINNMNSFLQNNIPTKAGTNFIRWIPSANVSSLLDAAKQKVKYNAVWAETPNTASDNKKINSSGAVGFSYLPASFNIANVTLNNSGLQSIPFGKNTSLNIGVRDQSNSTKNWKVDAQLSWRSPNVPSNAYIQIGNPIRVTKNTNNGTSPYNQNTDLKPVNGPLGTANTKITTTPITIINNNGSTVLNGVYDFDLGNVSLVLPDSQSVAVGSYSATVTWNLVIAP